VVPWSSSGTQQESPFFFPSVHAQEPRQLQCVSQVCELPLDVVPPEVVPPEVVPPDVPCEPPDVPPEVPPDVPPEVPPLVVPLDPPLDPPPESPLQAIRALATNAAERSEIIRTKVFFMVMLRTKSGGPSAPFVLKTPHHAGCNESFFSQRSAVSFQPAQLLKADS